MQRHKDREQQFVLTLGDKDDWACSFYLIYWRLPACKRCQEALEKRVILNNETQVAQWLLDQLRLL